MDRRDRGQAVLEAGGQGPGAVGDLPLAQVQVEPERLGQGPAVLVGVEPARLEQGRAGATMAAAADPGADGRAVEGRDGAGDLGPGVAPAPDQAGAAGANSHL